MANPTFIDVETAFAALIAGGVTPSVPSLVGKISTFHARFGEESLSSLPAVPPFLMLSAITNEGSPSQQVGRLGAVSRDRWQVTAILVVGAETANYADNRTSIASLGESLRLAVAGSQPLVGSNDPVVFNSRRHAFQTPTGNYLADEFTFTIIAEHVTA